MSAVLEAPAKPAWTVPDDQRQLLKIKLLTLMCESDIIRHYEKKAHRGAQHEGLHHHRVHVVRPAARECGLALGLIRGRTYAQMEPIVKERHEGGAGKPDWAAIGKMLAKYGGPRGRSINEQIKMGNQPM